MATRTGLISIATVDAYGIDSTTPYFIEFPDTATIADLITDVGELINIQKPLSQGRVTGGTVTIDIPYVATGTPAGDIEKGGLFNFNNASDPYATGVWIPDVNPSILNSSGLIDLTNTSVTDFITFLTTAHTVITVVTKGVRALTSLKDALISFRKHRKALTRRTKEV